MGEVSWKREKRPCQKGGGGSGLAGTTPLLRPGSADSVRRESRLGLLVGPSEEGGASLSLLPCRAGARPAALSRFRAHRPAAVRVAP